MNSTYRKEQLKWLQNRSVMAPLISKTKTKYEPNKSLENPYVAQKQLLLFNKRTGTIINIPAIRENAEQQSLRRMKNRLLQAKKEGKIFKAFWTLTFSAENILFFDGSGACMRKFLNKIQIYQKSKNRQNVSYLWKYEEGGETGRPHFHMFMNGFIPKEVANKRWGLGFVHQKGIKGEKGVEMYLNKYFTKDTECKRWKTGRRWSCSRDLPKYISEWKVVGYTTDANIEKLLNIDACYNSYKIRNFKVS